MNDGNQTAQRWLRLASLASDVKDQEAAIEALHRVVSYADQKTALYYNSMEQLAGLVEPSLRFELIRTMKKVAEASKPDEIPRVLRLEAQELLAKAEALENAGSTEIVA